MELRGAFLIALAGLTTWPGGGALGGQNVTTLYVGKHFEVRDLAQPVKYVFSGDTRVARATISLSPNDRIQRLRLWAGWNLISLAVESSARQVAAAEVVSGAFLFDTNSLAWRSVASVESLPAGSILWICSRTNSTLSFLGPHQRSPSPVRASSETLLHPGHGFEVTELRETGGPNVSVWRFQAERQLWEGYWGLGLPSDLDGPFRLPPGEAFFVGSQAEDHVPAPDAALSLRYYHQDHLGSSSVQTDATGEAVAATAFYPFGGPRHAYGVHRIEGDYGFTQKERDRESGLQYFEARYQHPGLGRFIGADHWMEGLSQPPQRMSGLNLYQYAANNPIVFFDPSGAEEEAARTDLGVRAAQATEQDSYFRGRVGAMFRDRIEAVAAEVDVNPGLLAASLLAETHREPYFRNGPVYSYTIGVDDYFKKRRDIADKVPASARVRSGGEIIVHPNDATSGKPRSVTTIAFKSGADALLASAVYLKHGEMVLRNKAAELGGDFDSLTVEQRFALTRIAFNGGHGRAVQVLKTALSGGDIFVRSGPLKGHPQRAGTVRAVQAMHLSREIFGVEPD